VDHHHSSAFTASSIANRELTAIDKVYRADLPLAASVPIADQPDSNSSAFRGRRDMGVQLAFSQIVMPRCVGSDLESSRRSSVGYRSTRNTTRRSATAYLRPAHHAIVSSLKLNEASSSDVSERFGAPQFCRRGVAKGRAPTLH